MSRARIAYVITRAEHGGAQVHLADLLGHFSNDFDLSLLIGEEGFLTNYARALGIQVHVLPDLVQPIAPHKDVKALHQAVTAMRESKPDLVHCHSSKAGLVGRMAAKVLGIPAVFTAHGWGFAEGVPWQRKAFAVPSERLAARWSRNIITVSEEDRNLALRYRIGSPEQLLTIHNGIKDDSARTSSARGELVRLTVVARFSRQKDHMLLLYALADVPSLPFEVLFIGDGPTRADIEKEALALELQPKVKFLGTRSDVPELLAKTDIFVLPSNWEGFPISILEAMRAGLPVIASDVGGVREAVVDGETGFLIPRGDAATLSNRLALLLESSALRERLGTAGRVRFENEFTFDYMLRKTLGVYEKIGLTPAVRTARAS